MKKLKRYVSKFSEQSNNRIIRDYFKNWKPKDFTINSVMDASQELINSSRVIESYAIQLSRKPGNAGNPVKALADEILKIYV